MRRSVLEPVVLSDNEREMLERWARRPKSSQALALRCRIVLACADGGYVHEVAQRLGVNAHTVGKWRRRFLADRLDGLHDEPRPGTPRTISDDDVEAVIVKTLEETPVDATHWSTRSMAKATGMSQSAISRIWRAFGLKPHLVDTFKLSPDPLFVDKVRDIVGSTSTHPMAPSSCASTRRPRSKPSIEPPRCCRCAQGSPSGTPMTTCATGRPTSMRHSTWPRGT